MTERERLISLLRFPVCVMDGGDPIAIMADYLLANGVIVPPCKIGDTVYRITFAYGKWEIRERECIKLSWFKKHNGEIYWVISSSKNDILGDSVFLTKEEAEAAVKEREKDV